MQRNKLFTTIFFVLIFSIVFFTSGKAQSVIKVYPYDKYLYSQSQVNEFAIENYTAITGRLQIQGDWTGDPITDLTPLNSITSIGDLLFILYSPELTNLNGLQSLTSVGGLYIQENAALTSIAALENLTSVGGNIQISANPSLTSLTGLDKITSLGGFLAIINNISLTDINGLGGITSVVGTVTITYNEALINLDGLNNLTSIGYNLYIYNNTALTNLDGLEGLLNLGGDHIEISGNSVLESFCGLHPWFSSGNYNPYVLLVEIYNNLVNPTVSEIIALGPCAPDVNIVSVDIFPVTCPNELNSGAKGAIPVAILGTNTFDIQTIDLTTLVLEGISPLRWTIKDVATPVINGEQCDCTIGGPDGFADLNLKFDAKSLIAALGTVNKGDELVLKITGNLLDGTPIEGSDCVIIAGKSVKKDAADDMNSIPEEIALFENYPNPFNPSTIINYQLPDQVYVSLIVYDLLGREVATLVNEVKPSGYFEVEFNASALPSGVYIYRLQAGNFVESKKMMLLK